MSGIRLHHSRSALALQILASSHAGRGLVLRGSWLLRLWFGGEARVPHDLDFVDTRVPVKRSDRFVTELCGVLQRDAGSTAVGFVADQIATTDIWTYEKTEGRRLVIPWVVGEHTGAVQVDITFDEEIPGPIEQHRIDEVAISNVSMETSLAWKLLWLLTDGHPQARTSSTRGCSPGGSA